jgi:hypothetical protein
LGCIKSRDYAKKSKKGAQKEQKLRQTEENVGKPLSKRDLDSMTKAKMKDLCKEMGLKLVVIRMICPKELSLPKKTNSNDIYQ